MSVAGRWVARRPPPPPPSAASAVGGALLVEGGGVCACRSSCLMWDACANQQVAAQYITYLNMIHMRVIHVLLVSCMLYFSVSKLCFLRFH